VALKNDPTQSLQYQNACRNKFIKASHENLKKGRPFSAGPALPIATRVERCRETIGAIYKEKMLSFCHLRLQTVIQMRPGNAVIRFFASYISNDVHASERLAASILSSPLKLILDSAIDRQSQSQLTSVISERLDLPKPGYIPSHFEDFESQYESYASLIVEETRYTIASALRGLFTQEKTAKSTKKSIPVRFTENCKPLRNSEHSLLEMWSLAALSKDHRNELRNGTVVLFRRKGSRGIEKIVLGTIHNVTQKSITRKQWESQAPENMMYRQTVNILIP
jgi:hypothetical protein